MKNWSETQWANFQLTTARAPSFTGLRPSTEINRNTHIQSAFDVLG